MRRLFLTVGLICTAVIGAGVAGLGYLGVLASTSADSNKAIAIALVEDVSQSWSMKDIRGLFTEAAAVQAQSRAGQRGLAVMSRLGRLQYASNVRQTGYRIDLVTGTTVTVSFDGRFQNGTSEVTLVFRYVGAAAKVVELDLQRIRVRRVHQRTAAV